VARPQWRVVKAAAQVLVLLIAAGTALRLSRSETG